MYKLYHWVPDHPDYRDHHVTTSTHFQLVDAHALPTSLDLRQYCSPVEDQGQLGSCTGNALVGAMEFLENKLKVDLQNGSFVDLSRLFVYYNERLLEHTVYQDSGAQLRDGVKTLSTYGVCTEQLWPYQISRFRSRPRGTCYSNALTRRISAYARVGQDIASIKQALASGYPVVFGFTVYDGFESDQVAETGVLNMPQTGEQVLGGHAVLCVGYDDASQRIIVRNSWGSSWGQAGYFTMPYSYITNPNLAADLWTITR